MASGPAPKPLCSLRDGDADEAYASSPPPPPPPPPSVRPSGRPAGNGHPYPTMGISKTEVNLLRLLDSAPRQQNQAKLIHYVTTSRELLEKLAAENTSEGISRLNEYSDRIEELAARLASLVPGYENAVEAIRKEESYLEGEQIRSPIALSPGLRRRLTALQEIEQPTNAKERNVAEPLRLDEAAQANIEKYRNLQEDLTDEIVELARQLKDSSLMMNQSVQATEKILDSTERAVAYSLAGTDRANARAVENVHSGH
uniref:Uncharacterized protein n=2 Tax=Oryza glumipatula TaxID=40148 RepID=A0A0E0B0L5_9ORYZ